jgi:hypothetical protein
MHHSCAVCVGELIWRNGSCPGQSKYQRTLCGYQARFVSQALRCVRVKKMLVVRNSQRSIVRVTAVTHMAVAKLLKISVECPPAHHYSSCGRKGPRPRNGRRSNGIEYARLWSGGGAEPGFGWALCTHAAASWPGCCAAATRPRPAACSRPCPAATGGFAGT